MSLLQGTLSRLRARAEAPVDSYLSAKLDVERDLAPLREAVAKLKKAARPDVVIRPTTLQSARVKWAGATGHLDQLDGREIRALTCDEETATDVRFVSALRDLGTLSERRLWLEGMIAQYLLGWRSMAAPDALERLLRDSVERFRGRSARIGRCKQNSRQLFSSEAARWLAESTLDRHVKTEDILGEWGIAPSSGLGQATLDAAVRGWANGMAEAGNNLAASDALAEFRFLTDALLPPPLVTPSAAGRAMSVMVLTAAVDRDSAVRDAVQTYILESRRFGDPRLPANQGNWAACEPTAVRKVRSWFSKQDLDFFFRVALPTSEDPHGRREFWERYLHQVVDCIVVLSPDDDRRVRALTSERLHYVRMAGTNNVSAFLMRFHGASDLIVIEFSRPGNALRFYDAETFERRAGEMRAKRSFHVSTDLKNDSSTVSTFTHHQHWKHNVATFLAHHGIRRLQ